MLSRFKKLFGKPRAEQPPFGKIEVFSRHCFFSTASSHKKRHASFSREICARNLIDTIDLKKANLTFFLDVAKGKDHFVKSDSRFPVVECNAGCEAVSFLQLLDLVEKRNFHPETILYFVEDDYLHRPGWTDILLEGMQIPGVDYATLYDHRDKYFFPMYRNLTSRLFATASCHWRTVPSTTHTFAVRAKTLLRDLRTHQRFSRGRQISADHEKFCFLQKQGAMLVSSIPGWSTHAEPEFASPCIDWENLMMSYR